MPSFFDSSNETPEASVARVNGTAPVSVGGAAAELSTGRVEPNKHSLGWKAKLGIGFVGVIVVGVLGLSIGIPIMDQLTTPTDADEYAAIEEISKVEVVALAHANEGTLMGDVVDLLAAPEKERWKDAVDGITAAPPGHAETLPPVVQYRSVISNNAGAAEDVNDIVDLPGYSYSKDGGLELFRVGTHPLKHAPGEECDGTPINEVLVTHKGGHWRVQSWVSEG